MVHVLTSFSMEQPSHHEGRFDLSRIELTYLGAMYIACGNWEGLDNSEESARDFLLNVIGALKSHGYNTIRAIVWIMQNTLMAQRKSHFLTIQKEPPYMRFTFRNLLLLDEAWSSGRDQAFHSEWDEIFASGWKDAVPPHELIRITGGPGDSEDTAFIVHAPDAETRICAQYWYLYYTYGRMYKDWQPGVQGLTFPDEKGREFDVMNVRLPEGREEKIFFIRHPKACIV